MILAAFGNLAAQVTTPPPATSDNGTTTGTPAVPADQQTPDNSQLPDNSQNPNAPLNPNNPQQNTYGPLLPQQANNPYSPYSTYSTNPQSSQLTAPSTYVTGARDLSQVGTSDALIQAFGQPEVSGFASDSGAGYSHAPIERIIIGPFDLKSALILGVVNDDNLRAGEMGQGKVSDTSFTLTPAILLQYGNHEGQRGTASLVYTPSFSRYLHNPDENSDNQNVAFNAVYPFSRLTLDLAETFTQTTGYNTDQNSRTTQESSLTTFGGSYDVDDKLGVSTQIQHVVTSFSSPGGGGGSSNGTEGQGQGDTTTAINTTISYRFSDKLSVGPSVNVGVDKPEDEKQETFEQGFLGLTYLPTEKIGLYAQAGVEFRQGTGNDQGSGNQNNSNGDETNPIFSAGVNYTPFDSTTLSLNGSQSVHSSSAQGQGTVLATNFGFSATQRFFQRLYLNLLIDYAYQDNNDQTGSNSTGSSGSQETLTYRPSLLFNPTAWSSVSVYYQYLDNQSGQQGLSYHDNQVGMSFSVQF